MIRERTADSAWFLIRTMGTWRGMSQGQVCKWLKESSAETVRGHAWILQGYLAQDSADAVRKILVGELSAEQSK
jgi:hypothetical protein